MLREKTVGKPCAGNPHARFERGSQMVEWLLVKITSIV